MLMTQKVGKEKGTDCSEPSHMYCPQGQYCNNGHCKDQVEDDKENKNTFAKDIKEMNKEAQMTAKDKAKKLAKQQVEVAKEAAKKAAKDNKSGQKGGEYELDINELLSESSFN